MYILKYINIYKGWIFIQVFFLALQKFKTTLLNIIVQFQLCDGIHRKENGSLFAWSPRCESAGFYFLMKKISTNE